MTLVLNNMISQTTHDVLKLMSFVILADGHVCPSEIDAFVQCAKQVPLYDTDQVLLDDRFLTHWFHQNQKAISEAVLSSESDVELVRLVTGLSGLPNKDDVVKAMIHIGYADGYLHETEKVMISIVRAYWA